MIENYKVSFFLSQTNKVLRILTKIKRLVALEGLFRSLLFSYLFILLHSALTRLEQGKKSGVYSTDIKGHKSISSYILNELSKEVDIIVRLQS